MTTTMTTTKTTTTVTTSMIAKMPMYSGYGIAREMPWAVAPHGSIICKRRGTTMWLPGAVTKQDPEANLATWLCIESMPVNNQHYREIGDPIRISCEGVSLMSKH